MSVPEQIGSIQNSLDEAFLTELVQIFTLSMEPNNEYQMQIYKRIEMMQSEEKFSIHMASLLPEKSIDEMVRVVAGHSLKAHLQKYFAFIPVPYLEFIQFKLNEGFVHAESADLQRAISNSIGAIIRRGGLACWPGLMEFLLENLLKPNTITSSLKAIKIIMEDSCDLLQRSKQGRKQLATLWQKLLIILKEEGAPGKVKEEVMTLLNTLLWTGVESIMQGSTDYFTYIFKLCSDPQPGVRKEFYFTLLTFLSRREDLIAEYRTDVYQSILHGLKDNDSEVRLAACNFWPQFFAGSLEEDEQRHKTIQEFLPELILLLAKNSIFAEADKMDFMPDESDFMGDQENSEDSDRESSFTSPLRTWTVRRCSAYVLERLSKLFGGKIFDFLKSHIEQTLTSKEKSWLEKESMMLILGAIAQASKEQIQENVQSLIQFLSQFLRHEEALFRATTLWTLSRFVSWFNWDQILQKMVYDTLESMFDKNLAVRAAACKCLSTIIQRGFDLNSQPVISGILENLSNAFDNYRGRSLLALFDIISQLCTSKSVNLSQYPQTQVIKDKMLKLWDGAEYEDSIYPAFIECIHYLINQAPSLLQSHAGLILSKNLDSIRKQLNLIIKQSASQIDRNLIFLNYDCISAIASHYTSLFEAQAAQSDLIPLLKDLIQINESQLQQFTIALIGDVSQYAPSLFEQSFEFFVEQIVQHFSLNTMNSVDPLQTHFSLCNNACWCVGQLAIKFPKRMEPAVGSIMMKIVELFNQKKLMKSIAQNNAITLGRLGLSNPLEASKYLEKLIYKWSISIRNISNSAQKESSYLQVENNGSGMCEMMAANPNGAVNNFQYFCDAVAWYQDAPLKLEKQFRQILHSFKLAIIGKDGKEEIWRDYFNSFPQNLKEHLSSRFQV